MSNLIVSARYETAGKEETRKYVGKHQNNEVSYSDKSSFVIADVGF